jgi:ArsR family transcriptional regulator
MEDRQSLAKIAAALSDPIRLQILSILVKGRDPSCVSSPHPQLPHALGNIAKSKLSYHLKELREAGLVEEHRLGKQVFYLVHQETLAHFLDTVKIYYLTPSDLS